MARRPRTECPKCGRDVAVSVQGRTWRHDPATGRTPELTSCPGSLKPVLAPDGDPVLFVHLGDTGAAVVVAAAPALF